MKNLFFENLIYLIARDFLMVKIWPYFHKSIWVAIFVWFLIFLFQKHIFWKFYMGHYSYGLCEFSFSDFQIKKCHK
jgi:hypothetical protein